MKRPTSLVRIFLVFVAILVCECSAFAASNMLETVLFRCGDSKGNNDRLDRLLQLKPANIKVALASVKDDECDVLFHHAASVPPGTDISGQGSIHNEVPNAHFRRWSKGDRYEYRPPTYGDPKTYSGTGGIKVEHASCWVSNVWGLSGSGVISRRFEDGQTYLNWLAMSVEPPKNQCAGQRIQCVDDPDATGFHHIPDTQANKIVRAGTAGHDLSQLLPVEEFFSGWITVRIRMRLNAGNNRFYVRLIQGIGRNNQMNRGVSHTLPGITFAKTGEIRDYVLITNLREQEKKLNNFPALTSNQTKYAQIALTSALPQFSHDVDVFRVSFHRGIGAPDDPAFGSTDTLIRQHGVTCN